jgi:alkaline phosphatase D
MRNIVRRGTTLARPDLGHSVHVDVQGLEPARSYWYRFMAGEEVSRTGRARTFPIVAGPAERLRFAYASCQHYGQGYFNAYRHMAEQDLDLVIHLGDYIYESNWGPKVRFHLPEPITLEHYRNIHALYKLDADLQTAHALFPWLVTWDDHEVDNDYAGDFGENDDPKEEFIARRKAAYQAYYEHMPLRALAQPASNGSVQLYTGLSFGNLAHISTLDNRQYRSNQACDGPTRFGGQVVFDCKEVDDPARSMLGREQENWLINNQLRFSPGKWKIIAQQQMFARLNQQPPNETRKAVWTDGWDGYAPSRQRILQSIHDRGVKNVVVLAGDIHQNWVNDLRLNFDDEKSPVVGTEFVGTSVTSVSSNFGELVLPQNPHVRFHEWRYRGYVKAEVTPARYRTDYVVMDNVVDPKANGRILKSFVVEDGKAGALTA